MARQYLIPQLRGLLVETRWILMLTLVVLVQIENCWIPQTKYAGNSILGFIKTSKGSHGCKVWYSMDFS
jgi:hypothetical protein